MKRVLLYASVLMLVSFLSTDAMDVAKLRPVQVVSLYQEGERIVIETDTQDRGEGSTPQEALNDLERTTSGVIYLDTAQYLLVTEDSTDVLEAFRERLNKSVKLCVRTDDVDLTNVAKYLSIHDETPELKDWKEGVKLPVLHVQNGRFYLS